MRQFFLVMVVLISTMLFAEINRPAYETGYRSYTIFGNTPILPIFVDYENAQWLPSVLPELGKGWVYIDNNGQLGGVVFPLLDRKLFMQVFVEYDPNEANYIKNSPRQIVGITRGTVYDTIGDDDYIAPLSNTFGFGFSGDAGPLTWGINLKLYADQYSRESKVGGVKNTLSNIFGFGFSGDAGPLTWGINLKLYADQYSRESKVGGVKNTLSNSTYRIELTPSVSKKGQGWRADAGLNFLYQWISNETSTEGYEYPYNYSGNAEFALYGRAMYDLTKYTTLVGGLSFGYAGASDDLKDNTASLDNTYLGLKFGALIKPLERLTLGSNFLFYHCWGGMEHKVTVGDTTTKTTTNGNELLFNFTQTVDFAVTDWFTLKAGSGKDIIATVGDSKTTVAGASATGASYDNSFDIGKFIGASFLYKELTLTMLLNFDFLTRGPNFISGATWVDPMAFVATLNYRW